MSTLFLLCVLLSLSINIAVTKIPRIVVDVDAGTDDIQALAILLNSEQRKQIKIEAILCSHGNTKLENVERNVIRFLETAGRTDIPLYSGSFLPILPMEEFYDYFYGIDGFGDLNYTKTVSTDAISFFNSPSFIAKILKENQEKITFVILGPMTNLALALRMYKHVPGAIKEILVMGGNYGEARVEFNFLGDPESVDIVLKTAGCPITMLTWQGCISQRISYEWYRNIRLENPVWDLMNRAEESQFSTAPDSAQWIRCDPILAGILVNPNIAINSTEHNLYVDLHLKRGLLRENTTNPIPNVKVIEQINAKEFADTFYYSFASICDNDSSYTCQYIY